jgi:hypothetical protein
VLAAREPIELTSQLVNGDPVGNLLLDAEGVPLVIDVALYWRPVAWADAVTVLDTVLWEGADLAALSPWRQGLMRQVMLRALAYRMLSDDPADEPRYRRVVDACGLLAETADDEYSARTAPPARGLSRPSHPERRRERR